MADPHQPAFIFGRVILSLFDYSGVWSQPYVEAGYHVIRYDLQYGQDVRLLRLSDMPSPVHGILAAPPCDHFAGSGARWWQGKGQAALLDGLSMVDATLRIVTITRPIFWVLENPIGRLVDYLGEPVMYFDPCDYGDPYTKRTALWGNFNTSLKQQPVEPVEGSKMHHMSSSWKVQRSETPAGFARAFFEANP